ncbi:hypothetical protein [Lewinella sp. W8]|uniref:hypothetical protein n=1 Tax=Lewinella sp. W8 TaxID=2528208 RepID=UPI001067A7C6|nr:hypothetical protein [Lewinella sp. W8]MTB50727.1 hypothetical protein [Lewinella sp. W8]
MNIEKNPKRLLVSAAIVYCLTLGGIFWGLQSIHPKIPQPKPVVMRQDAAGSWWLKPAAALPGEWSPDDTKVVKAFRGGLPVYYWVEITGNQDPVRGYPLHVLPKSAELPEESFEGFLYFRQPMDQSLGEYVME